MTASSCKRMCVTGSNEISCPRVVPASAQIEHQQPPGDVYQPPEAPRAATACQLCRSVSQTHRLLLSRGSVLHTILSLSRGGYSHTRSFTCMEDFSGTSCLFSPPQHTHTYTNRGYYGRAYQQSELIKPYLQPLNFFLTGGQRKENKAGKGLLILDLDVGWWGTTV